MIQALFLHDLPHLKFALIFPVVIQAVNYELPKSSSWIPVCPCVPSVVLLPIIITIIKGMVKASAIIPLLASSYLGCPKNFDVIYFCFNYQLHLLFFSFDQLYGCSIVRMLKQPVLILSVLLPLWVFQNRPDKRGIKLVGKICSKIKF